MSGTPGRSGRPPKPIELKRKLGTDRPDRTPRKAETVALAPAEGAPVPMVLAPEGRELWRTAQEMAPWVSRLDLQRLETLCRDVDDAAEMRRVISEDGLTLTEPIVTPAGMMVGERKVPHPLLSPLRALEKEAREIASTLGFDPTARSRLGLAEVKAKTKLQELLERQSARGTG